MDASDFPLFLGSPNSTYKQLHKPHV